MNRLFLSLLFVSCMPAVASTAACSLASSPQGLVHSATQQDFEYGATTVVAYSFDENGRKSILLKVYHNNIVQWFDQKEGDRGDWIWIVSGVPVEKTTPDADGELAKIYSSKAILKLKDRYMGSEIKVYFNENNKNNN